jgi:inhibitor of KinA
MTGPRPRLRAVGDRGLLVELAETPGEAATAAVLALDRVLAADPLPGQCEVVPALVDLLVVYDPCITGPAALAAALAPRLAAAAAAPGRQGAAHVVPVCYEPPFARDLAAVAAATGLSPQAVVEAHAGADWHVAMVGFAPGYAYLAGGPAALALPRKPAPVRDIPAGSVVIAGRQSLVTALTMPTGWWVIGQSPLPVLTGDPARPFRFAPGDRIAFRPVPAAGMPA